MREGRGRGARALQPQLEPRPEAFWALGHGELSPDTQELPAGSQPLPAPIPATRPPPTHPTPGTQAMRYLKDAVASGQAMGGGGRQWSGLGDAFFYLGACAPSRRAAGAGQRAGLCGGSWGDGCAAVLGGGAARLLGRRRPGAGLHAPPRQPSSRPADWGQPLPLPSCRLDPRRPAACRPDAPARLGHQA